MPDRRRSPTPETIAAELDAPERIFLGRGLLSPTWGRAHGAARQEWGGTSAPEPISQSSRQPPPGPQHGA
jgi:hypothetical protein